MKLCRTCRAPARRIARAGALAILVAACDEVPGAGPPVLELANDTITLQEGASIVDVTVQRTAESDFDPAAVEAQTGDVVRFVAGDNGSHAIVFESRALQPDVREYIERTGQMRSPPLLTNESSWVVTLEGAPAGEYPFRCSTHGQRGLLSVSAP
ncbi:MAG TPA: plastocyanin/azurin family copper-binding protein [Longimicrobiales bacterium]|nr:plastocyanin/azurin family copper-binding protein [Longimicrobiales bacterium]